MPASQPYICRAIVRRAPHLHVIRRSWQHVRNIKSARRDVYGHDGYSKNAKFYRLSAIDCQLLPITKQKHIGPSTNSSLARH